MYYDNEIKIKQSPKIIKKFLKIDNNIKKEIFFFNKMKKHLHLFDTFVNYTIIENNVILIYKVFDYTHSILNQTQDKQKNNIIKILNENGFYSNNYQFIIDNKNNYKLTNVHTLSSSMDSISSTSSFSESDSEKDSNLHL
jgi:hypothetical protein